MSSERHQSVFKGLRAKFRIVANPNITDLKGGRAYKKQ